MATFSVVVGRRLAQVSLPEKGKKSCLNRPSLVSDIETSEGNYILVLSQGVISILRYDTNNGLFIPIPKDRIPLTSTVTRNYLGACEGYLDLLVEAHDKGRENG